MIGYRMKARQASRTAGLTIALLGLALGATPAVAKDRKGNDASPEIFRALVDCRRVADSTQRLACFDKASGVLEQAAARKELIIADKEMIREARRAQFGFTMPSLRIFGGSDAEDDVFQLVAKVTSAKEVGRGEFRFALETGSVWEQIEARTLSRDPRPGMTATVRRHALGRYTASFDGGVSITVRRVQ